MMTAANKITGVTFVIRFLLAVTTTLLLTQTTHADEVTWRSCDLHEDARYMSLWPTTDYEATDLNLDFCYITEIHVYSFNKIPNIDSISLVYNNIKDINDQNVFSRVPKLTSLVLDQNKLTYMPILNIPKLERLSVQRNLIQGLYDANVFFYMKELDYVEFEHNQIEYINPDIFQRLTKLQSVGLRHNRLIYIADKTFALKSICYVNLAGNSIAYLSPGAFRGSSLDNLQLQGNQLNYLPENFVSEITKGGGSLAGWFFFSQNPFQCSCLLELLAEVKKLAQCDYNRNFYAGNFPLCTFEGAGKCNRLSEKDYQRIYELANRFIRMH